MTKLKAVCLAEELIMGTDMAINAVNKDGNSKRGQLTFIFNITC